MSSCNETFLLYHIDGTWEQTDIPKWIEEEFDRSARLGIEEGQTARYASLNLSIEPAMIDGKRYYVMNVSFIGSDDVDDFLVQGELGALSFIQNHAGALAFLSRSGSNIIECQRCAYWRVRQAHGQPIPDAGYCFLKPPVGVNGAWERPSVRKTDGCSEGRE